MREYKLSNEKQSQEDVSNPLNAKMAIVMLNGKWNLPLSLNSYIK